MASSSLRRVVFAFFGSIILILMTITTRPQVRPAGYNQYPADNDLLVRIKEMEEQQRRVEVMSASMKEGAIAKKRIDLTVFVVFHRKLSPELYKGLPWNGLRRMPASFTPSVHDGEKTQRARETEALVDFLEESPSNNQTTLIFLATNDKLPKEYDESMTKGRILFEHDMPGFDEALGTRFHDHGAMNTIFFSNVTHGLPSGYYGTQGNIVDAAAVAKKHDLSKGEARARFRTALTATLQQTSVAADHDNDGVQEWIGVFQHDMKIDGQLLTLLRKRIERHTLVTEHANRAISHSLLSPLHAHQLQKRGKLPQSARSHCCVFYAMSYPTVFLLENPLGQRLLESYNRFYNSSVRLSQLPSQSVIDAFVVPSVVFNNVMPWLHAVMDDLVTKGEGSFPPSEVDDPQPPKALDVVERALALALGAQSNFVHVQIPLRHEKAE